jgi:methylglutaconyl-CoA hydratase
MTKESEAIILVSEKDDVATITLNRPAVHNAFDEHMIAALSAILETLRARDDIRAIVLKGEGKSFCAGADIGWMKRAADFSEEQNYSDALALAKMLQQFYTMPQLTVAFVRGAAFGGGMGLVCCADIVVADETARFGLSEVKIGLIPATISPYVIRAIGARHARRYFQTGERFDSRTAFDMGLVHECAARTEEADFILRHILQNVASNSPQAMRASKALFNDVLLHDINDELLQKTAKSIAQIRATDEAKDGLDAFLNKRPPSWVKEHN